MSAIKRMRRTSALLVGLASIACFVMAILYRHSATLQQSVLKGHGGDLHAAGMILFIAEMWIVRANKPAGVGPS